MKTRKPTTLNIKLFGILRERMKSNKLIIPIGDNSISLESLKKYLEEFYPALGLNDTSFVFAVNKVICNEDTNVFPHDEIAIIPPISGG
jgi:molybdopterin synthase sulfur carrier subunit